MNKCNVKTEGYESGSNTVTETVGQMIDAVMFGLKYDNTITVTPILEIKKRTKNRR